MMWQRCSPLTSVLSAKSYLRCLSSINNRNISFFDNKRFMSNGTKDVSKWQAYSQLARIDKPIGTWLLYIPCTWSIGMASYHFNTPILDSFYMLGLFGLGSFIMRGAGCTINDMWDSGFDGQVERTRNRPLANGTLSHTEALKFLALQLSGGLFVLSQLNWNCIMLGAASLPLVAGYPLAKRFIKYPQFILGLTFNWGALLGWSAIANQSVDQILAIESLPLYAAGVAWTLVYDTIYAHQDKKDDMKIGVKSTAITFGDQTKPVLKALTIGAVALWSVSGVLNDQGTIFFISSLLGGLDMFRVIRKTDLQSPQSCGDGFRACQRSGWIVTCGIFADMMISRLL